MWARPLSVGAREYYTAAAGGVRLDAKFELHRHEYRDEPYVRYQQKLYYVERSYEKENRIELTVRLVEAWRG